MRDASYFRSQAELCLVLARQMSDPRAAESFRESAADYLAKAVAIEAQMSSSQSSNPTSVDSPPPPQQDE